MVCAVWGYVALGGRAGGRQAPAVGLNKVRNIALLADREWFEQFNDY
jgi:hypothetical protein